ncbi:uncharacterized protein FFB14_07931 [Fusarium fujikuroi]
MDFDL